MKSFPGRKNLNSTVILALKISSDKVFLFLMCKSTFCHLMACPFTLYFLPFHTFFCITLFSSVTLMQNFLMFLVCFQAELYCILQAYFLLPSEVVPQAADNATFLSMLYMRITLI